MSKNEELIRAAEMLKEHCASVVGFCDKKRCCLHNGISCSLRDDSPDRWGIPKLRRWTPEDVALAKALKAAGVVSIYRPTSTPYPRWQSEDDSGWLPKGSFASLKDGDTITLDRIIEEGE